MRWLTQRQKLQITFGKENGIENWVKAKRREICDAAFELYVTFR